MASAGMWVALTFSTTWGAPAGSSLAPEHPDAATQTHPATDPWTLAEVVPPAESRPLPRRPAPRVDDRGARAGTGQASAWLRTTASLAGVVALILLLAWGYRRIAAGDGWPARPLRPRHAPLIEVVSRAVLAPRQTLYLVRVGSCLVLVGCTPDAVRSLHVIQDADLVARLLGEAAGQRADSHAAEFARCLEQQAAAYEPDDPRSTEELTPDDRRLRAVRQKLRETIERLRQTGGATG